MTPAEIRRIKDKVWYDAKRATGWRQKWKPRAPNTAAGKAVAEMRASRKAGKFLTRLGR